MQLKLIPGLQEPIIHFSFSFPELPDNIPSPAAWTVQLSHILREDLEAPVTLHSLDRAAGIPSLLEEVTLDLPQKEIRCRFVDASVEEFAFDLHGQKHAKDLMDALEDIIKVVHQSTEEEENAVLEYKRTSEKNRERSMSVAVLPVAPVKPCGKVGKHKKQRSLFMQLVTCVGSMVNLTSTSTSSVAFRSTKRATSPTRVADPALAATADTETSIAVCMPPSPGAPERARLLRRVARSALVDTFRRFVLGELAARYYVGPNFRLAMGISENDQAAHCQYLYRYQRERGGFCLWILHSMKRRASERMEQILEDAAACQQMIPFPSSPVMCDDGDKLQTTTMDAPLSFSDEEDEEDTSSMKTEECGTKSSINAETEEIGGTRHTLPSTVSRRTSRSHSSLDSVSTHSYSTTSSDESNYSTSTTATSVGSDSSSKDLPDLPADAGYPARQDSLFSMKEHGQPLLHHLSLSRQREYKRLHDLCMRLNGLIQFSVTQGRVATEESRARSEMLLVRSQRRAWLNKTLTKQSSLTPSELRARGKSGAAAGSMYGFSAPFRSSPLAIYVFSADDLARQTSAISRCSVSSTSSLSSAYFRSMLSISSASSAASSLSKRSSLRPRIRPKIDFDAALAAAVIELDVTDADINDPLKFANVPFDNDCEFEIFDKPAPLRRHRRKRGAELPVMPAQGTQVFPLTEERTGDAVRGRNHRRSCEIDEGHRTFMGCDEIRPEDAELLEKQHLELGFGYPLHIFPLPPHGGGEVRCVEPVLPTDVGAEPIASETELHIHNPIGAGRQKFRPRARTNSMIGVLLRSAKGVQKTFGGTPRQQPKIATPTSPAALPEDSILCQPLQQQSPVLEEDPSFGFISYEHTPPPVALPKFAPNRRADEISRPASATAVYTNIELGVDAEMAIDIHVPATATGKETPSPTFDSAPANDEFTLVMDVPARRKRSTSYLNNFRQSHSRPKLNDVFSETSEVSSARSH